MRQLIQGFQFLKLEFTLLRMRIVLGGRLPNGIFRYNPQSDLPAVL